MLISTQSSLSVIELLVYTAGDGVFHVRQSAAAATVDDEAAALLTATCT